ncbi:MAG: TrpR YerC/YecD [Oscillospiraceae bacterium]|nr:TrpR YerC/YecD [Oscillospiraceae bacterium]
MSREQIKESLANLYRAITMIENEDEMEAFLTDLCTIKELQDMAQRLSAAKMLKNGENYLNIASEIGISTATISRVSRALNYGTGGYDMVLEKLREDAKAPEEEA